MRPTKPVVQVGNTIRRPMRSWSPAIESLLKHLAAQRFDAAPRWIGVDEEEREVLTYVEGDVPEYPLPDYCWSEEALVAVARLLRGFHDATMSYRGVGDAWRFHYPGSNPSEVICHNDIAPYNTVYRERLPVAFIDFDTAGPGPRVWDVSYAAYRFVPLIPKEDYERHGVPDDLDIPRRLRGFTRAYGGLEGALIEELILRLGVLVSHIRSEAKKGVPWHVDDLARGHVELYERHVDWLRAQGDLLSRALMDR
ncbi:MAG: phosphotransferase [Actinobacteria bacterium]|nr:phosphotransferase [Actinomycetota bacterium]